MKDVDANHKVCMSSSSMGAFDTFAQKRSNLSLVVS